MQHACHFSSAARLPRPSSPWTPSPVDEPKVAADDCAIPGSPRLRAVVPTVGLLVLLIAMLVPVTTADPILLTAGEPIDYYSYEHIVRNAHGGLVLIELQTSNFGLTGAESSSAQTLSRIAGVVKQFAFGDSYTASGYNPANGINNITYFGNTSSNGLNWFQYLALSNPNVNASRQLFDFAQFGATTSNAIVPSSAPDLVDQVIEFHKFFVPPPPQAPWLSKDTLFTIWISINDVGFGFIQNISYADAQPRINKTWVDVINTLYSYGARNFLVLGVPPTERTPLVQSYNATNITTFGENVNKYNAMLTSFIPWIPLSYPGTRAMLFDTQPFLNALLDDPYRYGFVDATDVCPAYEYVSGDPFVNSPLCPWPFTEMTWASSYHPTWPVHRLLAQVILNALQTAQSGGVIDSGETVLMNGSTASIEPTYIPIAVPTVTSSRSVANPTVAFTTAVVAGSTGVIAGRPPGKTSSASYTLRFNVLRAPMGPVLLLASCAAAVLMLGSMPSR